jgi:hypothetical protein
MRTHLMSPFRDRAGDIALQNRQADVEAGSQQELVTGCAEINLGINSDIRRKRDPHGARHTPHRPDEAGHQPAANNCSGLVPAPGLPEGDSLT